MEKKKNIIHILGEDSYGANRELQRLRGAFSERHSTYNVDSYIIEEVKDWKQVGENIQSQGLFAEKRLFIFRSYERPEVSQKSKKGITKLNREEILLSFCKNADENTFIIFFGDIFTQKSELSLWIEKYADIRKFDSLFEIGVWEKRFPELNTKTIKQVLSEYEMIYNTYESTDKDISYMIGETFEKISLIGEDTDINQSINISGGGKIFNLIDALMLGDRKKGISLFQNMLNNTSIYTLHGSLITLIRTNTYILFLKSLGKSLQEINNLLSIHPYIIEKAYRSPLSYKTISNFYKKILSINVAYRSGKGLYDSELGRIFSIERAIMGLKK